MPGCILCARGLCDECHLPDDECCLTELKPTDVPGPVGAPWKPDSEVKDPRSTMRKRAQKILKMERGIEIGSPCEWRGLADCGGGRHPIVGCIDGVVKHIHHGPDKDWYHNTPDNLHGICHTCHNRWHARNDECYDPTIPHLPRSATRDEMKYWNDGDRMPSLRHDLCSPSVPYTTKNKSSEGVSPAMS